MDPFSPLPVLAIFAIALAAGAALARIGGLREGHARFQAIDGLRGLCATGVFIHHAGLFNHFLLTRRWAPAPSLLYVHLGDGGVALFFMVTGFLFTGKLIAARGSPLDWGRLYLSRLLRLAPLYYLSLLAVLLMVFWISGPVLRVPAARLAGPLLNALFFSPAGRLDINGVDGGLSIAAGAVWTLSYEWLFYFSLPLLGLAAGVRAPLKFLLPAAALMIISAWLIHPELALLSCFAMGAAAQALLRRPAFRRFAARPLASLIALACLFFAARADFGPYPLYLYLGAAFALIAAGASLFGLLTSAAARLLGEISYSFYLLHMPILYFVLILVAGPERAAAWPQTAYWVLVLMLTPIVVPVAWTTFRLIEWPAMQSVDRVLARLRARQVAVPTRDVVKP